MASELGQRAAVGEPGDTAKVAVRDLNIKFHRGVEVLRDATFHARKGELIALVGPSGCGKSTALNAIASLLPEDEAEITGEVLFDGKPMKKGDVRSGFLGYVFQRDSLFPWRTVHQNIESGLQIHDVGKAQRKEKVEQLIQMVGLRGFEDYYPHQISGGMRQRTSLARTLAYDPEVILMDEPFGALDAQTRMILQGELIKIWAETRKTIIFVTHDLNEAITLGERVILFSRRPGTIKAEYEVPVPHPRDPFDFYGSHEFAGLHEELWKAVSQEFRESTKQQGGEVGK